MAELLRGERFFEEDYRIFLNRETEAFATGMHRHDFVELSLVAEGRGFHYVEDQLLEVAKGDLFLLPVGTSHVFRPGSTDKTSPLVVLNFIFDPSALDIPPEWLTEQTGIADLLRKQGLPDGGWYRCADRQDRFLALFTQAYREYTERSAGFRTMVKALLVQSLLLLGRTLEEERLRQGKSASDSFPALVNETLSAEKLAEALRYIELHYGDRVTLKDVADQVYMSAGHFQNQFKRLTGQTFNQYLQNVRIQKCCQLLRTTDKTVQQTANEVGYSDMKFFHSLFRRITGSSPQRYRRA
ncbi:AraC family transcriptional regulator [Cohnella thailandensis]|uniref:Helix-turn-helix transcriptional regulator n=1 Tax=Cohnella thailandensis TaxID=557557 RepID=A0A841T2F8_9BACL|nr:AraC family transcriptional regulator [Cohnella thailandensis]MBB6636067.1 helix-turn-helix transcriptional regulator [Cohnella thailandensis]MBP1976778.1 AraC-like DNA-binding protein [Cohnella thailandensis]